MGWDAAAGSGSGENAGKTGRQDERRDGTVWIRHASLRCLEDQTSCFPPTPHDSSGHDDDD